MDKEPVFLFDVDGTLTESRQIITPKMQDAVMELIIKYKVYLITGSDANKTIEQVGTEIFESVMMSMNCNCNSRWVIGHQIYQSDFNITREQEDFLLDKLYMSEFIYKTGKHIEHRPGMVNFSIVGRNADIVTRQTYKTWDELTNERHKIAEEFNSLFPGTTAQVAGDTGLDIIRTGEDKRQAPDVIGDLDKHSLIFYGDKMESGGNDYPLAQRIILEDLGRAMPMLGPEDTYCQIQWWLNV